MKLNSIASKLSQWLIVLLALCCPLLQLDAQPRSGLLSSLVSPGLVDPAFDPGSGANGPINSLALQTDGNALIGGEFSQVSGTSRAGVARLRNDGSLDVSFNPGAGVEGGEFGFAPRVNAMAVQSDGNVLIGGQFKKAAGAGRSSLARLHANGNLDASFNPVLAKTPGTFSAEVNALALSVSGILVGGYFDRVNGTERVGIARLKSDGSLDTTFNAGLAGDNTVTSIALQGDGKIIVAGSFSSIKGASRGGLARLSSDGALDTTFQDHSLGERSSFRTIALTPNGKVLVGGQFGTLFETRFIARLNADGTTDSSFQIGVGRQAGPGLGPDSVKALAVESDGKIVIGGWIHSVNGVERSGITGLTSDGVLDSTFNAAAGVAGGRTDSSGPRPVTVDLTEVRAIAVQRDGNILIAGDFTKMNTTPRQYIGRLSMLKAPSLILSLSGGAVIIAWPSSTTGFALEESADVASASSWIKVTTAPVVVRDQNVVTLKIASGARFYRLRKQ